MEPELQGSSIVLVGSFNPAIVLPAWLERYELLPAHELDEPVIEIVIPDVARFRVDWLQVQVTQGKFQLSTTEVNRFYPLRDVAREIFRILSHTPITALGINGDAHLRLASDEEWHAVGHALAPKDAWGEVLDQPGTLTLVIQGLRRDERPGYVRVTVEPSTRIHPGLYVGVNDHYQLDEDPEVLDASRAIQTLDEAFEDALKRRPSYYEAALKAGRR